MIILEQVRCILLGAMLTKCLYGEVVAIATYTINIFTSMWIGFKIPMDICNRKLVYWSNFIIVRAFKFVHIKQDKFHTRSVKSIWIGCPKRVNGYKLWKMEPIGSKLIISMNANFDETRIGLKCKDIEVKDS